jgi:hypothetical protein
MSSKSLSPLIWILIFTVIASCSRVIDKTKIDTDLLESNGHFKVYLDSNIFTYSTNAILTRDTEKIYPKSFKVKLPKGLKSYELTGSSDFSFYYQNNQVILIRIDLENHKCDQDTFYYPSENELEKFIKSKLSLTKSKYNIIEIPINLKRKQMFIKKGSATILLYNIEPKSYNLFYKYVNEFSFIEDL